MGYLHIENLYKNQTVLGHKQVYALEKVHGTSAHVRFLNDRIIFFAGGEKHDTFKNLFNEVKLLESFKSFGLPDVTVYGEAYGGKCQGMKGTYGDKLAFIAFDVRMGGGLWLNLPQAEQIVISLGLEFVPYVKIDCTLEGLNAERDRDSVVAVRRGLGVDKKREGIVIRPLVEYNDDRGNRVIAKHKRDDFSERGTPQKVVDAGILKVLTDARAIADEWVTPMRLTHVLDKMPQAVDMSFTKAVIDAMIEDVAREAVGEIVISQQAMAEIGRATGRLFKQHVFKNVVK